MTGATATLVTFVLQRWIAMPSAINSFLVVEFVRRDVWVGAFWDTRYSIGSEADHHRPSRRYRRHSRAYVAGKRQFPPLYSSVERFDLYVCVVPCFPWHYRWWARVRQESS